MLAGSCTCTCSLPRSTSARPATSCRASLPQAELAYQASQHTVEYWRSSWSVQQPNIIWHSASEAASSAGRSGTRTRHGQRPGRTWRVLFQTRTDAVRQLTNLQQLLDRCSNWQYTDPATGQVHRAQCGVWPVTAAPEVIAGALQSDRVQQQQQPPRMRQQLVAPHCAMSCCSWPVRGPPGTAPPRLTD